jgi:rubrerythrin
MLYISSYLHGTALFFLASALLSVVSCQVKQSATENDLRVLNYALTLEHLEANFYDYAQSKFDASAFERAGMNRGLSAYLDVIRTHERAHVDYLTSAISRAGGTPVKQCQYDFSLVTDVPSYLKTAALLENTGVSAYAAGPNHLSNPALAEAAATIFTVEARHASFLNNVLKMAPFPSNFDTAVSPKSVVAAASSFFKSCPGMLELPSIRPGYATASSDLSALPQMTILHDTKGEYTDDMRRNDNLALNYALVLEHLEAAFYNQFQQQFTPKQFDDSGYTGAYEYFQIIRGHENAHVKALEDTLKSRGTAAVPDCKYNFTSVKSVGDYVKTAGLLENTGVMAYDGAVDSFSDIILQQVAATIASVEARHAAYINQLINPQSTSAPFPSNTDKATQPKDIVAAAAAFFSSCPFNLNDPSILPSIAPPAVGKSVDSGGNGGMTPSGTPSPTPTPVNPVASGTVSTAANVAVLMCVVALASLVLV